MRTMLGFVIGALTGHRLRSSLSALGVAIGVATVILLTSLGEGTREYIIAQFTQFGTSIIAINPGKVQTLGIPGMLGGTTHKLDIEDAALMRVVGHRLAQLEYLELARLVFEQVKDWRPEEPQSYRDLALVLARHDGNVTHAAAALGVQRPYLSRLLKKLGVSRN